MEEKIFASPDKLDLISAPDHLPDQPPVHIEPLLELKQRSEVVLNRQPFTIDSLAKSSVTNPTIHCSDLPVTQSPSNPSDSCIHCGVLPGPLSPSRLSYSSVNCSAMPLSQSAAKASGSSMYTPCALPVPKFPPASHALMPQPAGSPTVPTSHSAGQGIGTRLSHAGSGDEMFLSPEERGAAMPKMWTALTNVDASASCSGREEDEASSDSAYESLCDAARSTERQPSVRSLDDVTMDADMVPTCLTLDQGRADPCEPTQTVTSKNLETESKSRTPLKCEQTLMPGSAVFSGYAHKAATTKPPPLQPTLAQHLPQETLSSQVDLLSQSTPVPLIDSRWFDSQASLHTPVFTAEPTFLYPPMSPILTPCITDLSPVKPQLDISTSSSAPSSLYPLTSSTPDPLSSESKSSPLDSSSQTTGNVSCKNHVTSRLDITATDGQKKEKEKSFLTSTNSDERAKRTRSGNRRKSPAKRKNTRPPQSPRQSRTENESGSECDEGADDNEDASGESKRKPRTVFTKAQLSALESEYSATKYLSLTRRAEFAMTVGLLEIQVKTWFQNRRMKEKRANKAEQQRHAEGLPTGGVNIRDLVNTALDKFPVEFRSPADRAEPYMQPAGRPAIDASLSQGCFSAVNGHGQARATMPTNVCSLAAWPSMSTSSPLTYMTSSASSLPLFQVPEHPHCSFATPSSLPLPVAPLTRTQDGVARSKQAWGVASPVSEEMTGKNSSGIYGGSADGATSSQSWRSCTEASSTVQPYAGLSTCPQHPNFPSIPFLHPQPISHFPGASAMISPSSTLSSGASNFFHFPPLTSHSRMQQSYQSSTALHSSQASSTLSGLTPARSSLTPDFPLQAIKYQGDTNPASTCSPLLYPAAYYPQSYW